MTDKFADLRAALDSLGAETEGRNGIPWFDKGQVLYEEVTGEFEREMPPIPETDMAYIAAANPETIRALLAERDGHLEQHRRDSKALREYAQQRDDLRKERDALRDALSNAAKAMWASESNMDSHAAEADAALAQPSGSGADGLPEGIAQFTKKPVTISAIRWTGDNLKEVIAFTGMHPRFHEWFSCWDEYVEHVGMSGGIFKIFTLEGVMEATPGDWIIRGVKGEHYPCKPDIFAATYDVAQPQPSGNSGE